MCGHPSMSDPEEDKRLAGGGAAAVVSLVWIRAGGLPGVFRTDCLLGGRAAYVPCSVACAAQPPCRCTMEGSTGTSTHAVPVQPSPPWALGPYHTGCASSLPGYQARLPGQAGPTDGRYDDRGSWNITFITLMVHPGPCCHATLHQNGTSRGPGPVVNAPHVFHPCAAGLLAQPLCPAGGPCLATVSFWRKIANTSCATAPTGAAGPGQTILEARLIKGSGHLCHHRNATSVCTVW